MTPLAKRGAWMAGALLLGAAGFLLFGHGPESAAAGGDVAVDWALPDLPSQELSLADAVWEQRTPWGERPATVAGEGEPETPPLMLVGVVAEAGGSRAVFILPGQGEILAKAGDPLPDGGTVTEVNPFLVSWTDGDGTRHEQALLADLSAPLPATNPTAGQTRPRSPTAERTGRSDRPARPERPERTDSRKRPFLAPGKPAPTTRDR